MNVLLSIKPMYVDEILAGKKIFEFRKSIFKKKDISEVFIYSSSPVKKIVASFEIARIIADSPQKLWDKCQKYGGISENDFFDYFKNSDIGYAIEITNLNKFSEPINPYKIKKDFRPPQSYCYLPLDYFENKSINNVSRVKNQDMVVLEYDAEYRNNLDDDKNSDKKQKQTKLFNGDEFQKMTERSEDLLKNSIMEEKIGWAETELNQVAEIIMGQSPPSSTYNENGIGLPFFQGKAEFTELYPIASKWCSEPKKIAEPSDILISVRAPVGATNIANQKCCIGRGLAAIRYSNCNKYVFYFLRLIEKQLDKKGTGTTFKAISGSVLKSEIIPLAPLPEQCAIVSKIEQLFSELDNGISNLKLAQEQLKVYRQAVLKKAFEGNWEIVTIGDKFDFIGGGTPSKKEPKYWNGEIPWCSVKDIKGKYLHSTIDKITNEGLKNSASNLAKVDEVILVTRISPGKAIIAKTETAINQDLKIIKPKFKSIPLFVYYLFNSLENQYVKLSSGTTVLGINLTNLKSIPIPNIPFGQQQTIVHEIETRLSVCDKIEQDIAENLEKAEALRQSILKKAFEGKLLNEKELAEVRGAEDWEPAEVLLKRIKAEKAGKK